MKKKITFVAEDISIKAGTERVLTMIANELSKKYDITIISLYNVEETIGFDLDKSIKVIKLMHGIKRKNLKYLYYFLKFIIKYKLKKYQTDYLVVAGMRIFPFFTFMKNKTKLIAWEHMSSLAKKTEAGKLSDIGRTVASKNADRIVVLTDRDRNNYLKRFDLPENKIIRIYNPAQMKNQTHKYDINSKKLLSSGRISTQKGYDYLVQVAKIVFEKHPDWQWDIYGEGECREEIQNLINTNNLNNNVFLKGLTNKMLELYKEYSLFIMTSRFEGFPMVNIEAHSAKLPIVSFDCPCGPSEMILDGENGYLVECFDVEKMAEKINYLIENPEVRQKMSDNTSLDKEKLKMENVIKEWDKVFE